MKNQQAHKAVTTLANSDGWAYMKTIMQDEILTSAYGLADNPEMSSKEIDFRRGAIWAAKQLLHLPEKVITKLENELILEEAKNLNKKDDPYRPTP